MIVGRGWGFKSNKSKTKSVVGTRARATPLLMSRPLVFLSMAPVSVWLLVPMRGKEVEGLELNVDVDVDVEVWKCGSGW